MSTTRPTVPAGTIVVGIDGSGSADQALAWAVEQAVLERRPLTVAHALETRINQPSDRSVAERLLDNAVAEVARRAPDLEVHRVMAAHDPRSLLITLSEGAETVVVGSHGRGPLRSLLLGSVGVALARHSHCPVLIHRPTDPGVVRRGGLVGVDGASDSHDVIEHAFRLASQRELPLTLVHCFYDIVVASPAGHLVTEPHEDVEEHRRLLAEVMAGLREKYPDVHVTTQVARGMPEAALVELADRRHLVVVGAHHGGLASAVVFRSVSAAVVEHASCPVMVVRH